MKIKKTLNLDNKLIDDIKKLEGESVNFSALVTRLLRLYLRHEKERQMDLFKEKA